MAGFSELPLIDLSSLDQNGGPDTLVEAFGRAFREAGFCYVEGHGIDPGLTQGVLEANRRFHALSDEAKQKVAMNQWHRGYMGFASSTIITSSVERATAPNQSESFMMMHEVADDDPRCVGGRPLQGPNQWPDDLPGFREALVDYNDAMVALSRSLTRTLARALGLDATGLDTYFEEPTTFLRLLHYPPHPASASDQLYGSAPHTDYGFFTLLLQDESGGLAVLNNADEWIEALPRPGCFVMNLGDMAMRWSNGVWRSTRHRVINRSGGDRYSAPFFYDMTMDCEVRPWPEMIPSGQAPAFDPVVYGEYLMHRIDANYDYRKGA